MKNRTKKKNRTNEKHEKKTVFEYSEVSTAVAKVCGAVGHSLEELVTQVADYARQIPDEDEQTNFRIAIGSLVGDIMFAVADLDRTFFSPEETKGAAR